MYKVYSFKDHKVIANVPALGRVNLSDMGIGKITVAYANDLASVTNTLDGHTIINKHHEKNGTVQIEIPQVGDANDYMVKWTKYVKMAATKEFASGEITVVDEVGVTVAKCIGVAPQKHADVVFDKDSGNRTWTMISAEMDIE